MADFEFEIEGLKELELALTKLPDKLAEKVLRGAMRDSARILTHQARQNARKLFKRRTGVLFRGIVSDVRVKGIAGGGAVIRARIGLRKFRGRLRSRKSSANDVPWYGRLLETGWVHTGRTPIRGGIKRRELGRKRLLEQGRAKRVPARPFLRTAFNQKKDEIIGIFQRAVRTRLEQVVSNLRTP